MLIQSQFLPFLQLLSFVLLAHVTQMLWYIPILYFMLDGTVLYWMHRIGHMKFTGMWHYVHVQGHHCLGYPLRHFLRPDYLANEVDDYKLNAWMYVGPSLFIWISLIWHYHLRLLHAVLLFTQLAVELGTEEYIHREIHKTRTWLIQYKWFRTLRSAHIRHHSEEMKCNFGVAVLFFDWLFGSLC
jgi:sterol desaturase/sphingolipid hydroxylase (fatty acid hydroxylase superfamily)